MVQEQQFVIQELQLHSEQQARTALHLSQFWDLTQNTSGKKGSKEIKSFIQITTLVAVDPGQTKT